jgi:hypothetical protein
VAAGVMIAGCSARSRGGRRGRSEDPHRLQDPHRLLGQEATGWPALRLRQPSTASLAN